MKQTKGKKGKKKRKQEAKPKNKFIIKGNNLYPIYIYIYNNNIVAFDSRNFKFYKIRHANERTNEQNAQTHEHPNNRGPKVFPFKKSECPIRNSGQTRAAIEIPLPFSSPD